MSRIDDLIAPYEPRLNWERRELHAYAGDGGRASRLISAVLADIGMKSLERDGCVFGLPEGVRQPELWLCTRLDGERSAEIAMLLCAARTLMAEIPETPAGFAFLAEGNHLPRPAVLLETSAEVAAGSIVCRGAGEALKAALSCCTQMRFEEGKPEETRLTLGTGGVKRFEKDLTLLPAGAAAMLIPALLLCENRG